VTGPSPGPDMEKILDALGDATRRRIVDRLAEGPTSVSALAGPLGITVTAVAQHLRILTDSGLATSEKTGRVRTCRLKDEGLRALSAWADQRRTQWDQRLDRLEAMLNRDEPGSP
jgi:DNA-binding transcriptional ArsR family regulator